MIIPSAALREIEHLLPPEMVAADAHPAAMAMAESLPDEMSAYGLEMRLSAPAGELDLAGAVNQSDGTLHSLSTYMRDKARGLSADDLIWCRLDSFFADWSNEDSTLHRAISHAWLEYDLAPDGDPVRYPGIFIAFHEDAVWSNQAATKATIERALTHLLGDSDLARVRTGQMLDLRRQLPIGAEIVHLGVMLSRAENSVRMVFRVGSQDVIRNFLEVVRWPGPVAAIDEWLNQSQTLVPPGLIHLEVGDHLTPRVDFEYRTAGLPRQVCEDFLSTLVSSGLCCPRKGTSLEHWIGWNFIEWPPIAPAVIWRTLHHFKLSFKPKQDPIAKAYLWVGAGQDPMDWLATQAKERAHA